MAWEWLSGRRNSSDSGSGAAAGPGSGTVQRAHREAEAPKDVAPPPIPGRKTDYRVVDVPGTKTRALSGSSKFADAVNALPLGPVLVTMRLQPNGTNPYGIAAYILGQQAGWLATQKSDLDSRLASGFLWSDPWVKWMDQLDAAGVLPRFAGLVTSTGEAGMRIVNVDLPGPDGPKLSSIAKRIIGAAPSA